MKALFRYFTFLVLLILLTNLTFDGKLSHPIYNRDPEVVLRYLEDIDQNNSQIVLVGNSELKKAVDPEYLSQLLDLPVTDASINGSLAEIWYLIIKNNIVPSEQRPLTVVLSFGERRLTDTGSLESNRVVNLVHKFAQKDEPVFDRIMSSEAASTEIIKRNLLVLAFQREFRNYLESPFRYTVTGNFFGVDSDMIDESVEDTFAFENMVPALLDLALSESTVYGRPPAATDFESIAARSFLPEIIDLLKTNGINLIIVRTPRRDELNQEEDESYADYLDGLSDYLHDEGVPFIDLAHDPAIRAEYFEDSLHMNSQGREIFTELLANELSAVLDSPAP